MFYFQTSVEEREQCQKQVILEKVKFSTKIKDKTEYLAKLLRDFSEDIVASDIEEWSIIYNPAHKRQKNPKLSIIISFYEESIAQKLCEISEKTKRIQILKRSLTKAEERRNYDQWTLINSNNLTSPDKSRVWLPEFDKGVIKMMEYPDSEGRRQQMKDVADAKIQGKDYLSLIPEPPS